MSEVPLYRSSERLPAATRIINRPGGNPGANLKSISHRCYLFEVAFVWELTTGTIDLPLGCLQGGQGHRAIKFQCGSIRRIEVRGGLGTLRTAGRCCKRSYSSPSSIRPPQPDGQPRGSVSGARKSPTTFESNERREQERERDKERARERERERERANEQAREKTGASCGSCRGITTHSIGGDAQKRISSNRVGCHSGWEGGAAQRNGG